METSIIKVLRNAFKDKNGNVISYCKLYCLVPCKSSDNEIGYDLKSYVTKVDNYKTLSDLYKLGKPVVIEFEDVELQNGLFKKRPIKINEISLK